MSDTKDPPISEQDYVYGPTVVDFGEMRVARGLSRRPHTTCTHTRTVYDTQERRLWCKDCERDVDPFDYLVNNILRSYDAAMKALKDREEKVMQAESHAIISIAAKAVDKAWRSKNHAPSCPHCGEGLLPEYFKEGSISMIGKEYAKARIERRKK